MRRFGVYMFLGINMFGYRFNFWYSRSSFRRLRLDITIFITILVLDFFIFMVIIVIIIVVIIIIGKYVEIRL